MDQSGAASRGGHGLGRRYEVCQGDEFDRVFRGAESIAGIVELRLWSPLAFLCILLGTGPPEGVSSFRDGSSHPSLLEAKSWQRRIGLLVLCQRRRHPAIVRMAKDEAFLRAGFRSFGESFLEVHLNSFKEREKEGEG